MLDCWASTRENKWTTSKRELSGMILLRSRSTYTYVMLITMRARNFCLQLDRKLANWLPIYPTGIYGSRLPIRIDVYPTWRHFSSMSSSREVPFLQPWIRTRTAVSEDVSTAMVAPSLQEVGNQTTFVHARIGDDSRRIRRLYPVLFKAIHKISKRPPCTPPLSPPPSCTTRISRSRLWSISH